MVYIKPHLYVLFYYFNSDVGAIKNLFFKNDTYTRCKTEISLKIKTIHLHINHNTKNKRIDLLVCRH